MHLILSTLVQPSVRPSSSVAFAWKSRPRLNANDCEGRIIESRKMRCASRTWRVKTAVWSHGVTYSLSPPRGRKATCPYTELGADRVCVFIRSTPATERCTREAEVKKEEEEVFVAASLRSWPRATCVGVQRAERRAIAMSAVIYEAIILVCRCRDREGCPPISPFLRVPTIPLSPPRPPPARAENFSSSHMDLPRSSNVLALLLACPGYFTADNGLRGLSAVIRRAGYLRDIET